MRDKKRKHEDDKKSWQAKHDINVEVIEVLQQKLSIQFTLLQYSVQLDIDYTAMPRIGRRGNSGFDSDGKAVCKH